MNYSISLFEVPRGHYSKTLKEAVRRYPEGYAARFLWADKTWLMCASAPLLVYPKCFHQHVETPQGLAVRVIDGGLFIYAWENSAILVCFWGTTVQAKIILQAIGKRENYQPKVWLGAGVKQELDTILNTLSVTESVPWSELSEREQQALKMMSMKRLSSKPWLGLFALLTVMILLTYVISSWAPWRYDQEHIDPGEEFANRLISTPGNVIPLLRLDYNQQLKLQQVAGWHLSSVDYSSQQISYRLQRDTGSIGDLRSYAIDNSFHIQTSGRNATLTRPIQLPSAINSPLDMTWHTVTELTDWLDLHLSLWLPTTDLRLGDIDRVGLWQKQVITVELKNYYLPDLLTLAGILDGLPLQLQTGTLGVQNNLIHGQITLQAIGALK